MAQNEPNSGKRKCAGCGTELPANVPSALCPKCLLKLGMETQAVMGPTGTIVIPPLPEQSRGLPQPGEQLGHYSIIRLLGAGGMGAAFEAEDLESGRRVALKVLSHTLDTPEARERFFREGRLAASINHPNSVYVFGTEEIGGTPVIAMELVAGGTLQERVRKRGPLPARQAVDCVLQIVAGLEAAQRLGILHRDIKPSNCFQDEDGTVKIGDFGLSISTTVRVEPALTATGAFLGTPAFCSPEQLRGDELNARSDMYSVGATLFYLLTGRTPFEGKNPVQLLATVLEQRAPSPRKLRPEVPQGLARAILRCLEKQPSERFKTYAELIRALAPYSSTAPTPGTLSLRFLAGTVDLLILGAINFAIILPLFGNPIVAFDAAFAQPAMLRTWMAAGWLFGLLYYALSESLRGATIGKSLFRLRVTRPDDSLPGFGTALVRALLYTAGQAVPMLIVYGGDPKAYLSAPAATQLLTSYSYFIILALLFSTVRRRNGFAAMHDLLTKTRVVARLTLPSRPSIEARESAPASRETAATVGPFHILETLEKLADASPSPSREDRGEGEWLLAYDLRLLRKVWVRRVAPGTPPVPAALRNLGRPGRLRWLAGRRAPAENWDAFEAPSGKPLLSLIEQPQPWSGVRFWLYDLSVEISAAEKDGTLPEVLRLDRVWITRDGMAKLLDFPAPGGKNFKLQASSFRATPSSKDQASAQLKVGELRVEGGGKRSEVRGQRSEGGSESLLTSSPTIRFLGEVAAAALEGHTPLAGNAAHEPTIPLPIHARRFLECLPQLSAAQSIALSLKPLLQRVTVVSRLRRAALIAGCLILPVFAWGGMFFARGILAQAEKTSPGLFELSQILRMRDLAIQHPRMMPQWPGDREVSLYIAHRYRTMITNKTSWSGMMSLALIKGDARTFAEQSVAEHPALTAKEIEEAGAALDKLVPKTTPFAGEAQPWMPWLVFAISLGIYVAVPALLAALLFRGGLVLLIAGVTFVRGDGARASRVRVFWRAIVTWSPLALAAILFGFVYHAIGALAAGIVAAIFFSGLAAISLALPNRGLADRLAGTWPVPR